MADQISDELARVEPPVAGMTRAAYKISDGWKSFLLNIGRTSFALLGPRVGAVKCQINNRRSMRCSYVFGKQLQKYGIYCSLLNLTFFNQNPVF